MPCKACQWKYASLRPHSGSPLNETLMSRLQKVQDCAARFTVREYKREHITLLLKELHWLPVKFQIQYNIATFAGILPLWRITHSISVRVSRNLSAASFSAILSWKAPPNHGNQSQNVWQRSFTFLGPGTGTRCLLIGETPRHLDPSLKAGALDLSWRLFRPAFN